MPIDWFTTNIPFAVFWREIFPAMLLLLAIAAILSLGYIQLRREVKRRRAAEIRLQAARDLADSSAQAQSTFFAMMSHEIRTPLSGIIGMLDLLKRASIGTEPRQMLLAIDSAANTLLHILDGVMDFAKVEANQMSLESTSLHLQEMVANVMMVMGESARRRGIKTHFQVDKTINPDIQGDPLRVRQILSNLIGNAAKFTRAGEILLRVDVEKNAPDAQTLRFEVRDTGIGIASDQLAQVMTPFRQADITTTRRYGGTGLGLSVSSRLARLMGGELTLKSEPGKGTQAQFRCYFPIRRPASASSLPATTATYTSLTSEILPSQARTATSTPTLGGISTSVPVSGSSATAALDALPCVLVADDHEINRELIQRQLTLLGYRYESVGESSAILEALQTRTYSFLLTDYQLPPLNAASIIHQWRAIEQQKAQHLAKKPPPTLPLPARLPIIVMTAGDLPEALLPYIEGHIRKPVTLETLRAGLHAYLPWMIHTPALAGNARLPALKQSWHSGQHLAGQEEPLLKVEQRLAELRTQFESDARLKQFLHLATTTLRTDFTDATQTLIPEFCERFADWLHRSLGALSMLGPWPILKEGNALEEALHRIPGPDILPELLPFLQHFKQTLDDIDHHIQAL